MKSSITILLMILLSSGAMAGLDPDPDQLGIYFDPAGDIVCVNAGLQDHVTAFILYTNPTLSTVRGFECSIALGGDAPFNSLISTMYPLPVIDIGLTDPTAGVYNLITGFATPWPTSTATVLCTLDIHYLDAGQLDLILGPADPASLGSSTPVVAREDYSLLPVGMSAPIGPAASINAVDCGVIPADEAAWDSIKAMYR